MAKFLSLENLKTVSNAFSFSLKRFSFTLLSSLVATISMIYLATEDNENNEVVKIGITFLLGVPLFFSAEIFGERNPKLKLPSLAIGILFLLFFYFLDAPDPKDLLYNKSFFIKYAVLIVAFHLLVSVAPFFLNKQISGFWQYNKHLFISILTGFLYSVTLSIGLVVALLGIQSLFEIKLSNDWYPYIWIGINGFVNTWIFTSKIPKLEIIDEDNAYPIGLKYFTQYVLLPLVAIYLAILVAYEFKILVAWSLPKGWVSIMVLASAIFGILAFLLINPLKNTNKWIQIFSRAYYWILLPLVGLMLVAIYVRIHQYGLSEPRYFVALLAIWLLGICLYFSFSKVDNIKVIPLSLLIISLLAIYAPYNAFQSSRKNQVGRMESVLEKNKLLKAGKIEVPKGLKLDSLDQDKLYASLEYLSENRVEIFEKYLSPKQFQELKNEKNEYQRSQLVLNLLNLPSKQSYVKYRYFSRKNENFIELHNADYMISSDVSQYKEDVFSRTVAGNSLKTKLEKNILEFTINDTEKIDFDLSSLKELEGNLIDSKELTFEKDSQNWKLILIIESGSSENGEIEYLDWKILMKRK
ncbi:DUF4153 domain-containing protein [Lacihabitans sp. LS3-19]|uniref:DUF4153 domain-containing protein n=1 Tax=Lacihabitans sp. LS3-19 TaxID=2487335 RepID=UPI0020CBC99A|nr:DUF4153 domain-containing protein [Lacihabitans sp. LS3-19]MCP9767945.1 DUF4153 domain-containing protein [Lacihabitans sp. LS3-19]